MMQERWRCRCDLESATAFGRLLSALESLATDGPADGWTHVRDHLKAMSEVISETYAVGMSLLVTRRKLTPLEGHPAYDRYVATAQLLLGSDTHPRVAGVALEAAASACMQSGALRYAATSGLEHFDPACIARPERPDERLLTLLGNDFADVVEAAEERMRGTHRGESWWQAPVATTQRPGVAKGREGQISDELYEQLFGAAAEILRLSGATVIEESDDLRDVLHVFMQACNAPPVRSMGSSAPEEISDADLVRSSALDFEAITLSAAPLRATLLSYRPGIGLSGTGARRHGFVTVTTSQQMRHSYRLSGLPLPDAPVLACLRTTVVDAEGESVRHVLLSGPEELDEQDVPIYVSLRGSALATTSELPTTWMRSVDRDHLSFVMDLTATTLLNSWCSEPGVRLRIGTRRFSVNGVDVHVIACRCERAGGQPPLIVMPMTELGARRFAALIRQDEALRAAVSPADGLLEETAEHLDIVINHLLFEEQSIGIGSSLHWPLNDLRRPILGS